MSGNVWQWTLDAYSENTYRRDSAMGVVKNPGTDVIAEIAQGSAFESPFPRALRGGSFLCSDSYCRGYRVSSRSPGEALSGASHIGFRTVMTVDQWHRWNTQKRAAGK
jgi:formylglycine-generating enzyme required for sulfatase activity